MKKFRHSHIIKKYSKEYEVEREIEKRIVSGKVKKKIKTYKVFCAFMDTNYEQQQSSSEFLIGDKIVYFIKNDDYEPKVDDIIFVNNKKYILKEKFDSDDLSDYTYFKARRVVDD